MEVVFFPCRTINSSSHSIIIEYILRRQQHLSLTTSIPTLAFTMAGRFMIGSVALVALAYQVVAVPTSLPGYDPESDTTHLFRRQCGTRSDVPAQFRQELVPNSRVCPNIHASLLPTLITTSQVHQNYLYKQLTDPLDCDENPACEIASTTVQGATFSWSAGGSVAGWISGGYEVGEYVESGQVANCAGDPGDIICVWWRAGYTSYQVQTKRSCLGSSDMDIGEQFYMLSPNKNGLGSSYICAKNDKCRNVGYEFWNDSMSFVTYADKVDDY